MEERSENGSAIMIIGWVMILFAFLVMFFHPAGRLLGQNRFAIIAGSLAVSGLVLSIIGARLRRRYR
jgi:NADH:ubiquinone oxidoreductase subunit 6 (subunit J)